MDHPIGRLEEVRAERRGAGYVVTEYILGPAGLVERLSARLPFFATGRGFAARWDQIDVSDPLNPRLLCAVEELQANTRGGVVAYSRTPPASK
jgi:hypothetical protein